MFKVIFLALFLLGSPFLIAKEYALIVTIGEYPQLSVLQGAHQDNMIYQKILKKWGVSNIVSLEDSEATRKNILYHLDDIAKKIQKHDTFYMFFSGHGSSLYDVSYSMKFQMAGLTTMLKDSAVIFPYDFDEKKLRESIIIGKRDLRPYLEKIDKKIDFGLIVFDTCYSEQSIRGNSKKINRTPNILTESKDYPYDHITYIASSITSAQSGTFSKILDVCIDKKWQITSVKRCIDRKLDKGFQIPVILEPK